MPSLALKLAAIRLVGVAPFIAIIAVGALAALVLMTRRQPLFGDSSRRGKRYHGFARR